MADDATNRPHRGKLTRLLAVAAILVVAGSATLAWLVREPYAAFSGERFLQIPRGSRSTDIARMLARGGVIRHESLFLAVRALRPQAILQAGEYRFTSPASPWRVFDRIEHGDVYYYSITVPEGSNIFDVARIVSRLDWILEEDVLAVVRDPAPVADLAPKAVTLEGYLFPSTYRVPRDTSASGICRMMVAQFRRVWSGLHTTADVHETVTLASLVEKETGVPDERPLVASVFQNRLSRGIPLACDPTVIYAAIVEDRYDGVINRSDLASTNPYNTYQHSGLPPGPIANPGLAALAAAIEPATTKYLFFVARPDGSGAHEFSETLAAHNRAVARYRRGNRQQRQN